MSLTELTQASHPADAGLLEQEADRLRAALLATPLGGHFDRLYAAQQALAWVADPNFYKAPFDMIQGTIGSPEGSEDCPSLLRPAQS
jgi:hypothetical protein